MGVHELDLEHPPQRDRRQTGRSVRLASRGIGASTRSWSGSAGPCWRSAAASGVVLYLAGWLLIPVEGKDKAPVDDMFGEAGPEVAAGAVAHRRGARLCRTVRRVRQRRPVQLRAGRVIAVIWYFGFYKPRSPGRAKSGSPAAPPLLRPLPRRCTTRARRPRSPRPRPRGSAGSRRTACRWRRLPSPGSPAADLAAPSPPPAG